MNKRKTEILVIIIFLILQTIIYIFIAQKKSYIHIDEAYSFGLSNYDKIDIQDNEDFFNTWHSKEYYEDYLAVQEDEIKEFKPVYENQKNDVHPPLYYLFLRICMGFTTGQFSIWPGIILNIIIYLFITIFMYLILKELFNDEKFSNIKAIILAFMSSIILASLSNVINIRMYSLSTLNILITTFLHIKLLKSNKINIKLLIAIGISVLAGVLTHYYYLFFLAILYLIFLIKYIKEKQLKTLFYYTLTMIVAGITSLIIFPYSLQHMFFGYRGQGVMTNLSNLHEIIPSLISQIENLNYYVFNGIMPVIIIIIILLLICNKIQKKSNFKIDKEKKEILKIIAIPSIFFFIITSIASPWKVLRYFVPICGLIFILAIFCLYKILHSRFSEKISNIIICILFCIVLISPTILKLKPELLYDDKKEIVQKISGELNLPTIYFLNYPKNSFLDDIFIFARINDSYIAKDTNYTKEDIQKIFENKDISDGILVFISKEEEETQLINLIEETLNFTNYECLESLNSCKVYHIY